MESELSRRPPAGEPARLETPGEASGHSADAPWDGPSDEEPASGAPVPPGGAAASGSATAPGEPPRAGSEQRRREEEHRREEKRREDRRVADALRKEYVETLKLNDAQVSEMEGIYRETSEARAKLREEVRSGQIRMLEALDRAEGIARDRDKRLETTLYPDQWKAWQDLERKRRRSDWMGGGLRSGPFESRRR